MSMDYSSVVILSEVCVEQVLLKILSLAIMLIFLYILIIIYYTGCRETVKIN